MACGYISARNEWTIDLFFKAIYVYLITGNQIANVGNSYVTLTECNFTLDGQHVGFFRHEPDESTEINYNVLGFSRVNLPNVDHTLRLAVGGVDYYVYVNFDYAIYTFDDGSPNSIPTTTPNPFPIPFPTPTIATNLSSLGTPTSVENLNDNKSFQDFRNSDTTNGIFNNDWKPPVKSSNLSARFHHNIHPEKWQENSPGRYRGRSSRWFGPHYFRFTLSALLKQTTESNYIDIDSGISCAKSKCTRKIRTARPAISIHG